MPKDEFDFDDPLELNGVAFRSNEDTTDAMCECFIEEFMRMGYSAQRILGLFRNPHYIGMHMAWLKRGDQPLRDTISQTFARWGRSVTWPVGTPAPEAQAIEGSAPVLSELPAELHPTRSDPMSAS